MSDTTLAELIIGLGVGSAIARTLPRLDAAGYPIPIGATYGISACGGLAAVLIVRIVEKVLTRNHQR